MSNAFNVNRGLESETPANHCRELREDMAQAIAALEVIYEAFRSTNPSSAYDRSISLRTSNAIHNLKQRYP